MENNIENNRPKTLEELRAELANARNELKFLPKSEYWKKVILLLEGEIEQREKQENE